MRWNGLLAAFSAIVVVGSGTLLFIQAASTEGRELAAKVELEIPGLVPRVSEFRVAALWSCRSDLVRAQVSLDLARLDELRASAMLSPDALIKARASLVSMLKCSPMDGNFWLRLATIDHELGRRSFAAEEFQISRLVTPYEESVLITRVVLQLDMDMPDLVDDADLLSILRWGNEKDISDIWNSIDVVGRSRLKSVSSSLSPDPLSTVPDLITQGQ